MSAKTEGTLLLDGLVEGKIPPMPGTEQKLRDWVSFARSVKLGFSLEITGGSFSLLADNTPRQTADVGPDPSEVVTEALRELLKIFPPGERARVTSTLRSVEYRPRKEVQTLYLVLADGSVDSRQRTVDADTVAPPEPLTPKERLQLAGKGLLVLVALFGISALFVDYRALWGQVKEQVTPLDINTVVVDVSGYDGVLEVHGAPTLSDDRRDLLVSIRRAPQLAPGTLDFDAAIIAPPATMPTTIPSTRPASPFQRKLALEALARGYARVEYFDDKGKFRQVAEVRIADLRDKESQTLLLPLPRNYRVQRVVLGY